MAAGETTPTAVPGGNLLDRPAAFANAGADCHFFVERQFEAMPTPLPFLLSFLIDFILSFMQ